jgi:hypothetical protein
MALFAHTYYNKAQTFFAGHSIFLNLIMKLDTDRAKQTRTQTPSVVYQ